MCPVFDEAKKHMTFREVWVGCLLGMLFLIFSIYQESLTDANIIEIMPIRQFWYGVQQNIRTYGGTLTAFLLAVGLPRLICCEHEYRTDCLIKTSAKGNIVTWQSKVLFTVLYCFVVVFIIGASSLMMNCNLFSFKGALQPVETCVYFSDSALPPMSNIAYCVLQYLFLFLGALYFAGFALLIAALTRRTALTIFLCGASYLVCVLYEYVGYMFSGIADYVLGFFYRFGFGGYLLQASYSWNSYEGAGEWSDVWKPILLVVTMILLEFSGLWLIWRRKARK